MHKPGFSTGQLGEPHLLLLSRYRLPRSWRTGIGPGWDKVLGESPQTAIQRLRAEGLLVPSSSRSKLGTFPVKDLKVLLKERQLPVLGNKDVLIERLVEVHDANLTEKLAKLDIVECSQEALDLTRKYLDQKNLEKQAVLGDSLAFLRAEEFAQACWVVARYESRQVFPRGIGVDWSRPDESDIRRLQIIFSSQPRILADLPEKDWEPLRVAASMMLLWGVNTAKEWLPEDFVGVPRFDSDTAARMLTFHATHVRDMAIYREMGVQTATIKACDTSCKACLWLADKPLPLDDVPELPFYACTHVMGCRCWVAPDIPDPLE